MFGILSQATAGELAVSAGGGVVLTSVVTIAIAIIKRGGKIVIGPENGKATGNGNSKVAQVVCPAHTEFSAKLDERHAALKEALATLATSQTHQEETLLEAIGDVKRTVASLSGRIDKAVACRPPSDPLSQ